MAYLSSHIFVPYVDLSTAERDTLREHFRVRNPARVWAEKSRQWGWHKVPEWVNAWEDTGAGFRLPRGSSDELKRLFPDLVIKDARTVLASIDVALAPSFAARAYQSTAVQEWAKTGEGIALSPTGSGKTAMGCLAIATVKQPTIWCAPTIDIVRQTADSVRRFLGTEPGILGDKRKTFGQVVTIATFASFQRHIEEIERRTAMAIIDECHLSHSPGMQNALSQLSGRYRLGLTATLRRRDGLHRLVEWSLGGVRAKVSTNDLVGSGAVVRPKYIVEKTGWSGSFTLDADENWGVFAKAMAESEERNAAVVKSIARHHKRAPALSLAIVSMVAHAELLAGALEAAGLRAEALHGGLSSKERERILGLARGGALDVLVGTSVVDVGLDVLPLARAFLVSGGRQDARTLQRIGRCVRPFNVNGRAKNAEIVDFLDDDGLLSYHQKMRQVAFEDEWAPPTDGT